MAAKRVQIYSKPSCHLCEQAKEIVLAVKARLDFELEEIDIESDPALFEQLKHDIPVVVIDGRRAFKHRVDARRFEERLTRG